MSFDGIDLSAFPVIRIDQIQYAESRVLRNAISEVTELVGSMISCKGPKPPLLSYFRRQLEGMHAELVERGAKERIDRLLSSVDFVGIQDSYITDQGDKIASNFGLQSVTNTISRSRLSNSKSTPELAKNSVSVDISDSSKIQKAAYNRIPLPSELRRKESLRQKELLAANSTVSSDSTTDACLSMHKSSLSSDITAASSNAVDAFKSLGVNDDDTLSTCSRPDSIGDKATKAGSASRGRKSSRRSALMSNNDPVTGSPSKKATAALYKDFGSQFLVAATEKKIRFYLKKAVFETDDEIRERSKNDRCFRPFFSLAESYDSLNFCSFFFKCFVRF
jgi:hypothetical protein